MEGKEEGALAMQNGVWAELRRSEKRNFITRLAFTGLLAGGSCAMIYFASGYEEGAIHNHQHFWAAVLIPVLVSALGSGLVAAGLAQVICSIRMQQNVTAVHIAEEATGLPMENIATPEAAFEMCRPVSGEFIIIRSITHKMPEELEEAMYADAHQSA